MSAQKHSCPAPIYCPETYRSSLCGRGAKYEHEGNHYCGTHHPPKVAEKDAARKAKRDAERAAMETRHLAARALAAETLHRVECFPVLLEALKDCREALRRAEAEGELKVVDAAIAKAGGAG